MQKKPLTKYNIMCDKYQQSRFRRNIPQNNNSHICTIHREHYSQWGKTENFSLLPGTKQGCSLSPLLFNIALEDLAETIRQQKEIRGIQNSKGEVKFYLRRHNTLHTNVKDSTKKLLELIREFSKVIGGKLMYRNLL